jgi:hypothetical protein
MNEDVYKFLKNLLDPDMFGMVVSAEVRDQARTLLGMKKVETVKDLSDNDLYTKKDR